MVSGHVFTSPVKRAKQQASITRHIEKYVYSWLGKTFSDGHPAAGLPLR